jgi:hypothetical protein
VLEEGFDYECVRIASAKGFLFGTYNLRPSKDFDIKLSPGPKEKNEVILDVLLMPGCKM